MITASLATYPPRRTALEQTVASLLPQVDRLNVWLNEYNDVPEFLNHEKICAHIADVNWGDAGKFQWTDKVTGHHLICDDDIIYPPDYAATMVAGIESYARLAVVGLHAVWVIEPVTSYYRDRRVINAKHKLDGDQPCHLLATNSVAYHTDTLKISPHDFPIPNYADPFFSILCRQQSVPCMALARKEDWIQHIQVNESLYAKFHKGNDVFHTKIIQLLSPWSL